MFPKVARLLINGVASVARLQVACLRHLLELLGNTSHIIDQSVPHSFPAVFREN